MIEIHGFGPRREADERGSQDRETGEATDRSGLFDLQEDPLRDYRGTYIVINSGSYYGELVGINRDRNVVLRNYLDVEKDYSESDSGKIVGAEIANGIMLIVEPILNVKPTSRDKIEKIAAQLNSRKK